MTEEESKKASLDDLDTNMRGHWYPVTFSEDLTKDKPVGLHLLGDPIVLFRDKQGKASCLADVCAHRSAPLSIGRMTDGELECKYHGWTYNNDGKVTHIPALESHRKIPKSACAKVYPCHEVDGLVYVFPDYSMKKEFDIKDIPDTVPGGRDHDGSWNLHDYAIDLNVDFSLMLENLMDPAHLPFTHENTLAKRTDARPLHVEVSTYKNAIQGDFTEPDAPDKLFTSRFTFKVPCYSILEFSPKPGWNIQLTFCVVPTRPGHLRLLFRNGRNFFNYFEGLPFMKMIQRYQSKKIVMQDYELLHGQQCRLYQGAKAWPTPIQVDRLPSMFRVWYERAMKPNPWFKGYKVSDIEDLGKDSCIKSSNCFYDEDVSPIQRGVDNTAYYMKLDTANKDTGLTRKLFLQTVAFGITAVALIGLGSMRTVSRIKR